jgi:IS30 family transposase
MRESVDAMLALEWSPEQAAHWLARAFPDDPEMRVSHETIYLSLFVQARGALRKDLTAHLRTGRTIRRSTSHTARGRGRGQIVDAVSIRQRGRPRSRIVPCPAMGGDLFLGGGHSPIATLVERQTRFAMLVRLPDGGSTEHVVDRLAAHVQTLPEQLRRSLTWDRGLELADHARFSVDTGVAVYFCDPRSPWQRGTNENTNGPAAPVLPQTSQHRPLQPRGSRPHRRASQRTASTNTRRAVTIRETRRRVALTALSPRAFPIGLKQSRAIIMQHLTTDRRRADQPQPAEALATGERFVAN